MIRHSLKVTLLAITLLTMLSFTPSYESMAANFSEIDVSFELILENDSTISSNILDYPSSITLIEIFSPECDHCTNQVPELDEL